MTEAASNRTIVVIKDACTLELLSLERNGVKRVAALGFDVAAHFRLI